jgi:tetratricopeptide (TPR) repeat protein
MALSEIEKLERRYAENPQGLTFAPLAEVHRKNGDVARALELLRAGLTLHPDYIPASIVLGRCHLDLGDLPAAEGAFTHVLSLDGENVIALKALADITERQHRFDESERWLRTLIAVDRSNDEARDQLGRVEASRRQAEVASSASPDAAGALVVDQEPSVAGATVADAVIGGDENRAAEPATAALSPPRQPEPPQTPMLSWVEGSGSAAAAEAAPLELEELDLAAANDAAPPAGMEIEQPVTLKEPVEPLSGLVGRDDREQGSDLHVTPDEWQVETAEDIVLESAGGGEFQVANAAEELLSAPLLHDPDPLFPPRPAVEREETPTESPVGASEPAAEPQEAPSHAAEFMSEPMAEATEPEPVGSADAARAEPAEADPGTKGTAPAERAGWAATSWAPPVAEPPRRSEPDLVVTESMAELLLQQGHTSEALTVYRHLEARTGAERFREKVAEMERMRASAAPVPAPEPAASSGPEPAATATPTPSYSVQQTQGQSVQAFLRGVLGARPPVQPAPPAGHAEAPRASSDAPASGAPTRPAHDSLSLSSVFGEESTPTPPAVPAAGPASAPGQGGVSYDEFFGAAGSGPTRSSRTPDSKSDDLDQFHAWLQNLKR